MLPCLHMLLREVHADGVPSSASRERQRKHAERMFATEMLPEAPRARPHREKRGGEYSDLVQ